MILPAFCRPADRIGPERVIDLKFAVHQRAIGSVLAWVVNPEDIFVPLQSDLRSA